MALWLYSRYWERTRIWIYVVSALLVIGVVIAFVYRSYPRDQAEAETETEVEAVVISEGAGEEIEDEIILPAAEPTSGTVVESEAEFEEEVEAEPEVEDEAESEIAAEEEPNLLEFEQPVAEDDQQTSELISEALSYLEERPVKIIEARDRLSEVLPLPMSEQQRAFVKGKLSELADVWLFSRRIFPQDRLCSAYEVERGDLLSTIGKQFKVPYEVLMQINNISRPETLRAGETIKVINGPFHARVYRSTFTMDLYLQNTFVRSFPVGLGKPGMETPTGLWIAKPGGKMITPTWTDPISGKTYDASDPDYPLGSRWIGLEGVEGNAVGRTGFAIHGTKDPHEIGIAGSQGCIRLHNGDAILVYNLLAPGYSRVEVVE